MRSFKKFKAPIQKSNISINKNNIFYLREDMIPFSFGGNKVRIAEEFFEDMKKQGGNALIGYGNARSNLCRVLANMCYAEKIPCCIISPADDDGKQVMTNNHRLVDMCKAQVVYCKKSNVACTVREVMDGYQKKGFIPYYIYGNEFGVGREAVPVRAYVEVIKNVVEFEDKTNTHFDYIIHASSTGMTQAGIICGATLLEKDYQIVGISTARKKEQEILILEKYIETYMNEQGMDAESALKRICFEEQWICGGYGKYNNDILETIIKVYQNDGVPLDPTYTGKAFWGMKEYLKKQTITGKNVLFIHTGGTPLFFDTLYRRDINV